MLMLVFCDAKPWRRRQYHSPKQDLRFSRCALVWGTRTSVNNTFLWVLRFWRSWIWGFRNADKDGKWGSPGFAYSSFWYKTKAGLCWLIDSQADLFARRNRKQLFFVRSTEKIISVCSFLYVRCIYVVLNRKLSQWHVSSYPVFNTFTAFIGLGASTIMALTIHFRTTTRHSLTHEGLS